MQNVEVPPTLLAMAVAAGLAFASCGYNDPIPEPPPLPEPGSGSVGVVARPGEPVDLATARRVHSRYADEISDAWAGVAGHGVGTVPKGSAHNPKDAAYVIVVFLESSGADPGADYSVDGVEIDFEVTGQFRILPAQ